MSDQKIYIVVKSTYKDLENLDVALVNRENICAFTDGEAALEYIKQKAETTHPNVTLTGRCTGKTWVENGVTMYETLWVDTIDLADAKDKPSRSNGADLTKEAFKVVHGMKTGKIGAREWLMIAYRGVELTADGVFHISGIPTYMATKLMESGSIMTLKGTKKRTNIIRLLMYLGPEYNEHLYGYVTRTITAIEKKRAVWIPVKGLTSGACVLPALGTQTKGGGLFDPPTETAWWDTQYFSAEELAGILRVSKGTVDCWIRKGGLKARTVEEVNDHGKHVSTRVVDEAEVAVFLNSAPKEKYRRVWNLYVYDIFSDRSKKGGDQA